MDIGMLIVTFYPAGFIWKNRQLATKYIKTSLIFYTTNHVHLQNYVLEKNNQKFIKRICHVNLLNVLTYEKDFPKTESQEDFGYGSFSTLTRIILSHDFLPSSSNSKEESLLTLAK